MAPLVSQGETLPFHARTHPTPHPTLKAPGPPRGLPFFLAQLPAAPWPSFTKRHPSPGPEVGGGWGPAPPLAAEEAAFAQTLWLESCLWSDWVGDGHTSSHFYRCWHHTWGGLGPGWWSPNGLRLLPTFPDPQTPGAPHPTPAPCCPAPTPSQTASSPPPPPRPSLGLSPSTLPALPLLYSSFMSQGKCHLLGEAFPDRPSPIACPRGSAPAPSLPSSNCNYTAVRAVPCRLCLPTELCEAETEPLPFAALSPAPPRTPQVRGSPCSLGMTALLLGGNTTPDLYVGSWQRAPFLDTRSNQDA